MSQEKAGPEARAPEATWPELRSWQPTGMHDAVFHAISGTGESVYVRADDGSGPLLRQLERDPTYPRHVSLTNATVGCCLRHSRALHCTMPAGAPVPMTRRR
jgi:hypothetical protein